MRHRWKLFLGAVVFALCLAPTFISYDSYVFRWDDADYLGRSIAVSRSLWSGDLHGVATAIRDIRPPLMSLLGVPWGWLGSWDSAGKCFITLTALTAFFVALSLFLLLRIGLDPIYLGIGAVCLLATLGPFPASAPAHLFATGFMADSLFGWNAFAAVLLIPYEWATDNLSHPGSFVRGLLWGAIFTVGVLTKGSFLYFVALVVPVLFAIRIRNTGLRSALEASGGFVLCAVPAAIFWIRFGRLVLNNAWAASFGTNAPIYYVSFRTFVVNTVRESPGMLLFGAVILAVSAYLLVRRREVAWGVNLLPLLIVLGYWTIALASSNREIRYQFTGLIALPFLLGLLIPGQRRILSYGTAVTAVILAFCCMLALGTPAFYRANRRSIAKSEMVVNQAIDSKAKHILLATDSSSLNLELLVVAVELSSHPSIEPDALAWRAPSGIPIESDFRTIRESDLIVFQNKEALDSPPATNARVPDYERYTRKLSDDTQKKTIGDISMYTISHDSIDADVVTP